MEKILLLLVLVVASHAFFKSKVTPDWNKLSVKYPRYRNMPLTEDKAIDQKWKLISDGCASDKSQFPGKRYAYEKDAKKDMGTILIFDVQGRVAGIQMAIPSHIKVAKNWIGSALHGYGNYYYASAYFTDISNICQKSSKRNDGYVGEKLLLSMGDNKTMEIPLDESKITSTQWIKGKCFVGMGQHYWYNISKNMDCNDFFPYFLLYNGDHKLTGFGFATNGHMDYHNAEHPTKHVIPFFFKPSSKPRCMSNYKSLTTQHVYLTSWPAAQFCL